MASLVQHKSIILASSSAWRRQLLDSAGLKFEVIASPYDEEAHKSDVTHLSIDKQAMYLAEGKALAVSEHYPDHLVIAADQIAEFDGQPVFKPGNRQNNIDQLYRMQGHTHYQHCAACVYQHATKSVGYIDSVAMTMRPLTYDQVSAYVDMDKPYGCCGGYQYEGLGKYLFHRVDGCYESVLGLPLLTILNYLQDIKAITLEC